MSEETTKKINGELNRKRFKAKYPEFWEKISYYGWDKDDHIRFEYRYGFLVFEIMYNTADDSITSCEVRTINDNNREKFAQDPVKFLLSELKTADTMSIGDGAIISFAQETILKAIKGA